ncbi:MAG TPA: hypothetical protein VMV68_08570 [Spirochaetia bacterium]|nr:hypothetical protein [Spirochaetia bacterium]
MVHILVEVNGFRQLTRLRGEFLESLTANLKGLVSYSDGACIYEERGAMLFELDERETARGAIGSLVGSIEDTLRNAHEDILGYTIVAEEYLEGDAPAPMTALAHMKRASLLTDHDDVILLGRRLRRSLSRNFACADGAEFSPVVERLDSGHAIVRDLSAFLLRPEVVAEIRAAADRLLVSGDPSWLCVQGAPKTPNIQNAEAALGQLGAGTPPWIRLHPSPISSATFEPLLDGLRAEIVAAAGEYLSRSERILWEQRSPIFRFECPDHQSEDFLAAYSLYLLAYSRYMARRHYPPAVICEDADRYSRETIDLLARLLRRLSSHTTIVAILLVEDPSVLGPLEGIPHEILSVPPFGLEEIRDRVDGTELGGRVSPEHLLARTGGRGFLLYHAFLLSLESGAEEDGAAEVSPLRRHGLSASLLRRLSKGARRILTVATIARAIYGPSELRDFFMRKGMAEGAYRKEVAELVRTGFVDGVSGRVLLPEVAVTVTKEFEDENLHGEVSTHAFELWRRGAFRARQGVCERPARRIALFAYLSRHGSFDQALEVFLELMTRLLDEGSVDQALHHLEHENLFRMMTGTNEARRRDFVLELLALRAAIVLQAREQADLRLVRLRESKTEGEFEGGYLELASAQHLYASGEARMALDSAKHALMFSQSIDSRALECRADIEIGLNMLASARFEEAEEYFSIGASAADTETSSYDLVRALCFESVSLYLFGNVSKALGIVEHARSLAASACRREWQRYALFLRGRCLFTLGMYPEADRAFRSGLSFSRIYPHEEASMVFDAWSARAVAHRDPAAAVQRLETIAPGGEASYFAAEALCELGEYDSAAEALASVLEREHGREGSYIPGEVVPWSSGYAGVEDRALKSPGGEGVLRNLALALRAFVHGRQNEVAVGIDELTRMTRDDRLSNQDPYLYEYHYLHSLVIPSGEGELLVNKLTALSKALKYVQQRATRIDDVKMRQSFLRSNRLNARLLDDAKRFKLM